MPTVAGSREQPGKRREAACNTRAHDRRLPADREDVPRDRGDRHRLGGEPRDPEEPGQPEHAQRQEGDVLAGHGQEVVEAGGLEVVAQVVRQPLVLAQDDPGEHGVPLAFEPGRDRACDVRAQAIREAADAAAPADDPPVAPVQDDVDAAAREPATLVEAVLRTSRRRDGRPELQHGSLGRRAAERQFEQHALAESTLVEAPHLGREPQRERRSAHRSGDDGSDRRGAADLRVEHARVEGVEPHAPPPPAGERERQRAGGQPSARNRRGAGRRPRRARSHPDAGARIAFASASPTHAASTSSVGQVRSIRETPRPAAARRAQGRCPGIASRSSTERKPPCSAR